MEEEICPYCHNTMWETYKDENGVPRAKRCRCYAVKHAKQLLEASGLSDEFLSKSFDNFDTRGIKQLDNAKKAAQGYVSNFGTVEHTRHNSIMFCGQVGSGKTHLGVAIAKALLDRSIPVHYMPYRDAITKLKQVIIDPDEYSRQIQKYTFPRVLYIDDFLKGKVTESDVNIMYEIINYRYINDLPVILSTERMPADIIGFDEAIGSRLVEMSSGYVITLTGKELDYRLSA